MLNDKFVMESYHSNDEDLIDHLLSICYVDDENAKMYFKHGWKSPLNVCTIIARDNMGVMGAITAWKSNFHPNCMYISICVHPLYRNDGLEKQLLEYAEEIIRTDLPLQTSIWETTYFLTDFYKKNDFTEIRRTFIASLNLSTVKEFEEIFIQKYSDPQVLIKNLKDVSINKDLKDEFVCFVKETYEKTHQDNPPGVSEINKWEKLIFSSDTLLEGSYVALSPSNDILGFALLHEGEEQNFLEFGWRGTKEDIPINLITLLTVFQIRFARHMGYEYIKGEVDTTDIYSLEMLKVFPFSPSPSPSLITYQKKQV